MIRDLRDADTSDPGRVTAESLDRQVGARPGRG